MMLSKTQHKILTQLREAMVSSVDLYTPFPKPFYHDRHAIKAIYLGCDPSSRKAERFCHAFALPKGGVWLWTVCEGSQIKP